LKKDYYRANKKLLNNNYTVKDGLVAYFQSFIKDSD